LLASHRGGPGSIPGHVVWDLWWTKWRWGRLSPITSVSPANSHSTDCSTFIIRGWYNRSISGRRTKWTVSPHLKNYARGGTFSFYFPYFEKRGFLRSSCSVCASAYSPPPQFFVFYAVRAVTKGRRRLVIPRASCC
jgi:hypothetical protein